jgi:hypothetical protein
MNNGGCNEVHQSIWHIVAELPAARTRRVPRQPDEAAADGPTTDRNERFMVQVFSVCMNSVIALSDRFAEDKISLRHRCSPFAPWKLMPEECLSSESIKELYEFYGLDPALIARELRFVLRTEVFMPSLMYLICSQNRASSDCSLIVR